MTPQGVTQQNRIRRRKPQYFLLQGLNKTEKKTRCLYTPLLSFIRPGSMGWGLIVAALIRRTLGLFAKRIKDEGAAEACRREGLRDLRGEGPMAGGPNLYTGGPLLAHCRGAP